MIFNKEIFKDNKIIFNNRVNIFNVINIKVKEIFSKWNNILMRILMINNNINNNNV